MKSTNKLIGDTTLNALMLPEIYKRTLTTFGVRNILRFKRSFEKQIENVFDLASDYISCLDYNCVFDK